jgi:hypothetical protein
MTLHHQRLARLLGVELLLAQGDSARRIAKLLLE